MAQANVSVEQVTHVEGNASNEDALDEITAAVNRQLERNNAVMMKQMSEKSELSIKDAIKRALERQGTSKKQKKEPEFKSKGNKIRYEANEEVLEKIEASINAIDNEELDVAKSELEAGKAKIKKQQKLIRIADREENGWEVVRHYLSDELASDSDDEKAIAKARKEALASLNKRKQKRSKDYFRNASQHSSQKYKRDETWRKDWGGNKSWYENKTGDRRKPICYKCGKEGHLQSACPLRYGRGYRN